ncbi:MAG TPA: ROK family protein [Terracidiphilus sp.]|jgi:glucokinase|nr:ROK family protein [Terracidiphilus sp.]
METQQRVPRTIVNAHTVLGFDIGGTKTACVEGTVDGATLQRVEMPTHAAEPWTATLPGIAHAARGLIESAARAGRTVGAVSVSVGGPLRIGEGFLMNPPHLPGWHNMPLKAELEKAFPGLPVRVEHDGNAGALAELAFGVGKGRADLRHLIFLTFGTGIGAGLIVNGQILRGATDTAGEVGHWRLAEDGPLGFGKRGSWESFASGAGLVELAAEMFPARWHAGTAIRSLVEAMLAGDADALEVAAAAGKWMGRGLALLIDALNPQLIVFGSLGVALGERVLGPARAVIAEEALPQAAAACALVPSALGARIGDVAALMAALNDDEVRDGLAG